MKRVKWLKPDFLERPFADRSGNTAGLQDTWEWDLFPCSIIGWRSGGSEFLDGTELAHALESRSRTRSHQDAVHFPRQGVKACASERLGGRRGQAWEVAFDTGG
eukprot:6017168-Pleurochrysis_carterae.AAC.2